MPEEKLNRCPLVNGAEVKLNTCRWCCFSGRERVLIKKASIDCNFEFKINKGAEESNEAKCEICKAIKNWQTIIAYTDCTDGDIRRIEKEIAELKQKCTCPKEESNDG